MRASVYGITQELGIATVVRVDPVTCGAPERVTPVFAADGPAGAVVANIVFRAFVAGGWARETFITYLSVRGGPESIFGVSAEAVADELVSLHSHGLLLPTEEQQAEWTKHLPRLGLLPPRVEGGGVT